MSMNFPNSYDMLAVNGILPYDVNQIISDKPSSYLNQMGMQKLPGAAPSKDEFKLINKQKTPTDPRKLGLAAIATYITGAIMAKSTNPAKGLQALGKFALNLIKLPLKVIKK